MTRVKAYRELEVWQVGMTLVEKIYAAAKPFLPDAGGRRRGRVRRPATARVVNER